MAGILSSISIVSFVIAGISFVLAVVFFFLFKIPNVIGDLSGRNAQRSIARLREINERSGSKVYKTSATNQKRGKLTGTIDAFDQMQKKSKETLKLRKKNTSDDNRVETGLLKSNAVEKINIQNTVLLETSDETGLLSNFKETKTMELSSNWLKSRVGGKKLELIEDIMIVHTNEVIE